MFPIRDTVPSRSVPVVTWGLIAANVLVFLYQITLPRQGLEEFFFFFGLVPASYSAAASAGGGVAPFFTSLFVHGGLFHLVANMWTLWIFGDNVEDRMGKVRFLLFYLLCGLLAGATHLVTNLGSTLPTVGASGAIAGVLGAYFLLFPHSRVLTLVPIFFYPLFVELPAFVFLSLWFVLQLLSGGLAAAGEAGGIAWWAHVGGFVAGLLLFRLFLRRRPPATPPRHLVLPARSGRR